MKQNCLTGKRGPVAGELHFCSNISERASISGNLFKVTISYAVEKLYPKVVKQLLISFLTNIFILYLMACG